MARRGHPAGWWQQQILTIAMGAMATLLTVGITFYFTTTNNDTKHDAAIGDLGKAVKELSETLQTRFKSEADQRAALSKQFLDDTKATNSGIADLNKQIAVQTNVLQVMGRAVEKLEQRIDAISAAAAASGAANNRRR